LGINPVDSSGNPVALHWTMIIQAYMDETGIHDGAPITAVAGYLASEEMWRKFSEEWTAVLREFGVRVFHATDYENFKGGFKGWTLEKKVRFAECLFPILPANTWIGLGYAVVNQDYEDALQGHERLKAMLSSPYMLCFQGIIERLARPFQGNPTRDRLAFFFENNDFEREAFLCWDWLKRQTFGEKLVSITFGSKNDFVPCQAADALAYETYKALDNQRFGKGRTRKSLEVMQSTNNTRILFWDRENLAHTIPRLEAQLNRVG
jgi:hypothetical protein